MKKKTALTVLMLILEVALWIGVLVVQQKVGQPWAGIIAFVAIGLLLLTTFFRNRKQEKEMEEDFDEQEEKAAKAAKMDLPEVESLEKLSYLLLLNSLSGKMYQVFSTPRKYQFVRVGGELTGLDPEKMLDSAPSDSLMKEMPGKNFSIDKADVQSLALNVRHSVSTQLPNSGVVTFCTPKKCSYVLLGEVAPEQAEQFFADLGEKLEKNQKSLDRQSKKQERDRAIGEWNKARQDPATFRVLRIVTTALLVVGAVSSLAFLYLGRPYVLWSVLCMVCVLASIVLGLIFPAYYSLILSNRESMKATGAKCIGLIGPILAGGFGPLLRTLLDFNFVPWWPGWLAGGILSLVLIVLFALRLRELKGRIGMILAAWFIILMGVAGIPGQLNALLDFREPDLEEVRVVDMHISTSSKGPDDYVCTVRRGDGSELDLNVSPDTYELTDVGDDGVMALAKGGLGFRYAEFYSYEELRG